MRIFLSAIILVYAFRPEKFALADKPDEPTTAFSIKLSCGDELVVVQEPLTPITAVAGVLSPTHSQENIGAYPIRLELRRATRMPIILWARLVLEPKEEAWRGFRVLAIRAEPGTVFIATAESFSIHLWKISLADGVTSHTVIDSADWSLSAAVISPINTNARAKIERSGGNVDGRLRVIVTESWPEGEHITTFEQSGSGWEFRPVPKPPRASNQSNANSRENSKRL